jgi:hypothetical protein
MRGQMGEAAAGSPPRWATSTRGRGVPVDRQARSTSSR